MGWKIDFSPKAVKELDALGTDAARRILKFLKTRLAPMEDPRSLGEALRGPELGKYWKYRVGDYRLVCLIEDAHVRVVVVRIGHRRNVYK